MPAPPPDPVAVAMERLKRAGWTPKWSYRRSCRALGEEEGGAGFLMVKEAVDRLRATATPLATPDGDDGDGNGRFSGGSNSGSSSGGDGYEADLYLRWAQ